MLIVTGVSQQLRPSYRKERKAMSKHVVLRLSLFVLTGVLGALAIPRLLAENAPEAPAVSSQQLLDRVEKLEARTAVLEKAFAEAMLARPGVSQRDSGARPPGIEGTWVTFRIDGPCDIATMTYTFRNDATFVASVEFKDGQSFQKMQGDYRLDGDVLQLKYAGKAWKAGKIRRTEDALVMLGGDVDLHFKRARDSAPGCSIALPPQADSLIKMEVGDLTVHALGVEKTCRGTFVITNAGPDYDESPTEIGPSYGVFIYDTAGTMLFRNFGSWGGRNRSGDRITIRWNTNSNHLGETTEPAFLIPEPGTYELVIIVYPNKRDTILCYAKKKFSVGVDQEATDQSLQGTR